MAEDDQTYLSEEETIAPPRHWRRIVFRFGFVMVLVMVGVIALVVFAKDDSADNPGPSTATTVLPAAWPEAVAPVAHTVPAMIQNALTQVDEQQGYTFKGTAGRTWHITVEAQSDSALDPIFTLYGPSGALLATADDRSADDLTAELWITLPDSGPYWLLVQSSQGGLTTGAYLLTLWEN
jgi:hypothetical protein